MPELPEVETIKRDLDKTIKGLKITNVEVLSPKVIKFPSPDKFKKQIQGTKIIQIIRKGKHLIFFLSGGKFMVVHLKLTGQLIYGQREKNPRVVFNLSDKKYLNFNDFRLFGELRIVNNLKDVPGINKLGIEPFDKSFTPQKFKEMLAKKKTKIKLLLLEQGFISGVGNLYSQEALYRAKIHPTRAANSLSEREIKNLYNSLIEVLKEGIKYRGSSVDAYVNGFGKPGQFHLRLMVYGRKNAPCLGCNKLIKRIELGGRGTYFCPHCQK